MISITKISYNERQILKNHYKKGVNQLIKERAHCILLSNDGFDSLVIAKILQRNVKTIRNWLKAFNEIRIASLFPRYEGNENASKLTKEQKEEIKRVLNTRDSLPSLFWDLPALKNYISATFGTVYESDRSYHYLLKYCSLSWKLPALFDIKRDEAYINKRMCEIRKEIQPFLHDEEWVVLVSDETRLNWEEEIRRCWLPKGKKTVFKLERNKKAQSYFGALNIKTGIEHIYRMEWQDTKNIINALKQIKQQYSDKRICLIWDNAAWHKSKELREELHKDKSLSMYHLINFPPYAPDMNPQEHVWNYGKGKISNKHFTSFNKLLLAFEETLTKRSFNYKI